MRKNRRLERGRMKIVKKYIVNVCNNFEEDSEDGYRTIIKSLYYDHKPTKVEVEFLMKKYKCNYVHIGTYFKRVG